MPGVLLGIRMVRKARHWPAGLSHFSRGRMTRNKPTKANAVEPQRECVLLEEKRKKVKSMTGTLLEYGWVKLLWK